MMPGDWVPVPMPKGDARHDIGDDARAAIAKRLAVEFTNQHGLSEEQARQLGMWAAASVRGLLTELGILHDMSEPASVGVTGVRDGDLLQRCCNHPDAQHDLICCACQDEQSREELEAASSQRDTETKTTTR